MPHTQHFTVAKWSGTGAEAAKVTFSAPPPFPINIPLSSRKPWQSCFALGVDDATAAAVTKLADLLVLPHGAKRTPPKELHLSLYRGFGRGEDLRKQLPRMVDATRGLPLGSVEGLRFMVKIEGDDKSYRTVT